MVIILRNEPIDWLRAGSVNRLTLTRGQERVSYEEFRQALDRGLRMRIKEYQGRVDSDTDPSGCFAKTLGEYTEALERLQRGEEFTLWHVTVPASKEAISLI